MNRRQEMSCLFLLLILSFGLNGPALATKPYVLSVQQLKDGLEKASLPSQKGFILVDVRTTEEHVGGFIPGTDFNIDFREIKRQHKNIGAKMDDHIVVYCQSGQRSNIAAETLIELGYNHVYNVAGSMNAWQGAGYPVELPKR